MDLTLALDHMDTEFLTVKPNHFFLFGHAALICVHIIRSSASICGITLDLTDEKREGRLMANH